MEMNKMFYELKKAHWTRSKDDLFDEERVLIQRFIGRTLTYQKNLIAC